MLKAIAIENKLVDEDASRQAGLCESYKQLAEDYELIGDMEQSVQAAELALSLELEIAGENGVSEPSVQDSLLWLARGYRRLKQFKKSNGLMNNLLELKTDLDDAVRQENLKKCM